MRIYISASYAAKDRVRPMRDKLFSMGHEITSTWLDEVSRPEHMDEATFHFKLGLKDFVEAGSADLLIQDTITPSTTGGLHVEWGIGLARFQRQMLWVVGPTTNVFHALCDKRFDNWEDLFKHIKEID